MGAVYVSLATFYIAECRVATNGCADILGSFVMATLEDRAGARQQASGAAV